MTVSIRTFDEDACACLVDMCTEEVFGPVFTDAAQADAFLNWLGCDARLYWGQPLTSKFNEFLLKNTRCSWCGDWTNSEKRIDGCCYKCANHTEED